MSQKITLDRTWISCIICSFGVLCGY